MKHIFLLTYILSYPLGVGGYAKTFKWFYSKTEMYDFIRTEKIVFGNSFIIVDAIEIFDSSKIEI